MKHSKRPLFRKEESYIYERPGLFSFLSIIPQITIIALVIGVYYFIALHQYFPDWLSIINWAMKIIIALEIIIAARSSLILSFAAILIGGAAVFLAQTKGSTFLLINDAWQLLAVGVIGVVITFIARSLRQR